MSVVGGTEGRVGGPVTVSAYRFRSASLRSGGSRRPPGPTHTWECVPADRADALYCRVSGSTGQESSLANQEKMLRESATGTVYRVYRDRGSGLRETRPGLNRMLDDAARVTSRCCEWCGGIGWRGLPVAWIERYLSVVGVKVEARREHGDMSLVEELLDDVMAVLASFSGRFHRLRSKRSQRRLLRRCAGTVGEVLADGRCRIHCAAAVLVHHPPLPGCR
nr:recombinase family protein [Rhodococcus sp. JVH1]